MKLMHTFQELLIRNQKCHAADADAETDATVAGVMTPLCRFCFAGDVKIVDQVSEIRLWSYRVIGIFCFISADFL